jgi:hypothetical protein
VYNPCGRAIRATRVDRRLAGKAPNGAGGVDKGAYNMLKKNYFSPAAQKMSSFRKKALATPGHHP